MKYLFLCLFAITWASISAKSVKFNNSEERSTTRYCLADDDNPWLFFGTKTGYEYMRQNAGSATTCKAIQMWILARHGSRHPDEDDFEEMTLAIQLREDILKHYSTGNRPTGDALCEKDLEAIRNWSWDPIMEQQPKYLTQQGWDDLVGIAKRYQQRYPELLGTYSPGDFYFRHSMTQRTEQSCYAFIDGLFGEDAHKNVQIETPIEKDPLIQTHSYCDAWIRDVDENDDRKNEKRAFRQSAEWMAVRQGVSRRLGFSSNLGKDPLDGMYDNCRFDKTKYLNRVSPWCAVFSKPEMIIMEYYNDIGRYYKSGYGHEYHPKLGCPVLSHLRETFEKTVAGGTVNPKTVAMFTHDTLIDMMFTAMNFSRDQHPLRGEDFQDLVALRKYRTSFKTPFAANVVAVLHDCGEGEAERYQVQFLLNERPMHIEGCDQGLCTWSFLENFLSFTKNCNLDFCFQ